MYKNFWRNPWGVVALLNLAIGALGLPSHIQAWHGVFAMLNHEMARWIFLALGLLGLTYLSQQNKIRSSTYALDKEDTDDVMTDCADTVPIGENTDQLRTMSNGTSRIFSPRTPKQLREMVKGKTEMAATSVIKPHLDTWIAVQGRVFEVSEMIAGDDICVAIKLEDEDETLVTMFFEKERWKRQVVILDKGDSVKARGKIRKVSEQSISLEQCELME